MSERKSNTLRMQGDPFIRKKAVRVIAIFDQIIAGILLFYAAYRLTNYDFRDQSFIVLIGARTSVIVAIVYWLGVFALIGLQLVIAFLLLTGIKDMTTDTGAMMKKCIFWKTFSIILLLFLSLDLFISIYIYFTEEPSDSDSENQRLASVILDFFEILFRILGLYFVSKFITDLSSLFCAPMDYDNNDNTSTTSTTMHRCSRANSLHRSTSRITQGDKPTYAPSSTPSPSNTVTDALRRTLPMAVGDNTPSIHKSHSFTNPLELEGATSTTPLVSLSTSIETKPRAKGPSEKLIIRTSSLKAPAGLQRSLSTSPTPTAAQLPINRTSSADAYDRVNREKLSRKASVQKSNSGASTGSARRPSSAASTANKIQRTPSAGGASTGSAASNGSRSRRGTLCRELGGPLIISMDLDDDEFEKQIQNPKSKSKAKT